MKKRYDSLQLLGIARMCEKSVNPVLSAAGESVRSYMIYQIMNDSVLIPEALQPYVNEIMSYHNGPDEWLEVYESLHVPD